MQKSRIAFQGERGAYSEMAALQYLPSAEFMPLKSFASVFEAVENGSATFAIVPVENSIEGSINEVYDLLLQTKELIATGEVYQRVHHCLIANNGVAFPDIRIAYSHPQALAQCRDYLLKKKIEPVAAYDTAGAVKFVKENHLKDSAAIASRKAAELYDMQILDEGIEDRKNNFTRFLVMSRADQSSAVSPPGTDAHSDVHANDHIDPNSTPHGRGPTFKTSLIFSVKHIPGALYGILGEFAVRGINLTKIESRPTKETPWEYNFYMDVEGSSADAKVIDAIKSVRDKTMFLKVVGSYRRANLDLTKSA